MPEMRPEMRPEVEAAPQLSMITAELAQLAKQRETLRALLAAVQEKEDALYCMILPWDIDTSGSGPLLASVQVPQSAMTGEISRMESRPGEPVAVYGELGDSDWHTAIQVEGSNAREACSRAIQVLTRRWMDHVQPTL